MYRLKLSVLITSLLLSVATPSMAEENGFPSILKDMFYGTLSGALVGSVVMAFTKHAGDHLDYIGYGAAGGAVVGATYGTVSAARSLAEMKDGKVKFAIPSVMPQIKEGPNGSSSVLVVAQLFRGRF